MAARKYSELRVIFDTNSLYTSSASSLFNAKILSLIDEYSNVADLKIAWYLPDVVVTEREYQMLARGKQLLPTIQKLEKLLGHNLNITEEIIHGRIKSTIKQQMDARSINTIELDTSKVDWEAVIHNALYRVPPFENGEKEKGFRDALAGKPLCSLLNHLQRLPSSVA